jgi:hypothetical protein
VACLLFGSGCLERPFCPYFSRLPNPDVFRSFTSHFLGPIHLLYFPHKIQALQRYSSRHLWRACSCGPAPRFAFLLGWLWLLSSFGKCSPFGHRAPCSRLICIVLYLVVEPYHYHAPSSSSNSKKRKRVSRACAFSTPP